MIKHTFTITYNEHKYCDLSCNPVHRRHRFSIDCPDNATDEEIYDAADNALYAWRDATDHYRNRAGYKRYIGMLHFTTLSREVKIPVTA